MVSQIGKPITQPQLVDIKLKNQSADGKQVESLVNEKLFEMPLMWKKIFNNHSVTQSF